MKNTVTKIRWFSITQYDKEAEFLRKMHSQGWTFIGVNMPCFFHFERCEPEDYVYQLDYNKNGSKGDYIKMFEDCGWEYITDFFGFSYFRKRAGETNGNEEIFCDDESRLDLVKRIFWGRGLPLLILFFCSVVSGLLSSLRINGIKNPLSIIWIVIAALYIWILSSLFVKYFTFKRRIKK